MYEGDDLFYLKRARDETGRSNKVLRGKHYAMIVICVCVMKRYIADNFILSKG